MQTTSTTITTTNGCNATNGAVPMEVTAAIVAAHAAAYAERRELRMLARCGELPEIDAQLLAADVDARAERIAARLSAVMHVGRATTLDQAIWEGDVDGLDAVLRDELAAASLL